MFKRFVVLRLLAFVLLPSLAAAQFTLVSGTVNDPNSLHYSYGTLTAKLVISGSPVITASNTPYSPPTQPVGLDVNGSFTMQLASNSALTPSGSTWTFSVCSTAGTVPPAFGTGPQCFTVTGITISGSTQSISSTLSAAAPALTVNFGNGTGTVTTFSAGNLSPLFTTSVATANTTPALSFTLTAAGANTLYGNFTGSSAGPTFGSVPSCSSANQALNWTAGTGFGCVTISGGGGVSGSGTANTLPLWTGSTALGNSIATQFSDSAGLNLEISPLGLRGTEVLDQITAGCPGATAAIPTNLNPVTTAGCTANLLLMNQAAVSSPGTGAGLQVQNVSSTTAAATEQMGISSILAPENTTGELVGIESDIYTNSSGPTITTSRSLVGYSLMQSNTTATQQGLYVLTGVNQATVTSNAGVYVDSPKITGSGGVLTNNYGLYIASQAGAGSGTNSNPFGIFEANTTEKNQLGALTLASITGSTQCLHASSTGAVTGTGSDCGSGGSTSLNSITAATANGSAQNSGNFNVDWQWTLTSTTDGLDITEPSASTGTGSLVNITSLATSTATPLTLSTGTSTATALNIGSGVIIVPVGTPANPSIAAAGHTQNGLHFGGATANYVAFSDQSAGTQESIGMDDQSIRSASTGAFRWTSTDINGSFDTCVDRVAPGIAGIDTLSACNMNQYAGALQLTNIFNYGQEYFPASAGSGVTNAPGIGGASSTVGEFCVNGTCGAGWGVSGLRVTNTGAFKFMSAGVSSTIEAGLSYDGSGAIVDVGNGTAGDTSGTVKLTTLIGTGSNGGYVGAEGTCANAAAVAGSDVLCPNSTAHWLEISGNNSTLEPAAGINGAVTANHFATFKNANEIQDGGATIPLSSLATQAANTTVANVTGGTAAPTAAAIPAGFQFYTLGTGYSTGTENNLAGAGAAGTITEGGATFSVTRAGIATANLTAPWVFQNTNSSNNNTSITMGISAPGTSTGQTVLNVNGASTGGDLADFGTGATWTAGVLSGQTIVAAITPTGSMKLGTAPTVTTPGTGAYLFGTEGTEPASIGSGTTGFVMDSTSHCPVQWDNAVNYGCTKPSYTLQVSGSDFTTASTSFVTITGLTKTLPLVAATWSFECDLIYSQATAAAADQFGVQTATNGATNTAATGVMYTAAAVSAAASTTGNASSTTAFSIVTGTPGGTGTKLPVHLAGTIEGASVSGTVLNIQVLSGSGSDTLTIYRGSECRVF